MYLCLRRLFTRIRLQLPVNYVKRRDAGTLDLVAAVRLGVGLHLLSGQDDVSSQTVNIQALQSPALVRSDRQR